MINRNRLFYFLRFFVSFFLIAFIISKVNLDKVFDLLSTVKFHFLLIGFLLMLLDRVIMSYRWAILLWAKAIKISILNIIKIYFLSSFWGNFLPSSVAPEVIKVYVASKHDANTSDVLSSVVVDRIIGLFSLSFVALLSFLFIFFTRETQMNSTIFWVILAVLFVIVLLAFIERLPLKKFQSYIRFQPRGIKGIVWSFLVRVYTSCNEYKNNKAALSKVFSTSFINHILFILITYILCLSLSVDVSILYLSIVVPLVSFLVMIPISLGGLGIQEGAYVYFLTQIGGVSIQVALTIALMIRFLMIVVSLPGGVIYVSNGFQFKKAVS